jgi:hypothetical protein
MTQIAGFEQGTRPAVPSRAAFGRKLLHSY